MLETIQIFKDKYVISYSIMMIEYWGSVHTLSDTLIKLSIFCIFHIVDTSFVIVHGS